MTTTTKRNIATRLIEYLRDSREEARKITWPSRKDTVRYSVLVIVLTILIAAFFGGLDWLFSLLLALVVT